MSDWEINSFFLLVMSCPRTPDFEKHIWNVSYFKSLQIFRITYKHTQVTILIMIPFRMNKEALNQTLISIILKGKPPVPEIHACCLALVWLTCPSLPEEHRRPAFPYRKAWNRDVMSWLTGAGSDWYRPQSVPSDIITERACLSKRALVIQFSFSGAVVPWIDR